MSSEILSYYEQQLYIVGEPKKNDIIKVKFLSETGETKWINLNDESIEDIVKFLHKINGLK